MATVRAILPGAAPEAQRGRAAGHGCTARQDVLLLSTCLTAGTAELPRGPGDEAPEGEVPVKQGGLEGRRNSGEKGWQRELDRETHESNYCGHLLATAQTSDTRG